MEGRNAGGEVNNVEELYAKPYKKGQAPHIQSDESEGLYDRLDRQNSINTARDTTQRTVINNNNTDDTGSITSVPRNTDGSGDVNEMRSAMQARRQQLGEDNESIASYPRSLGNQSMRSASPAELNDGLEKYQVEVLESKDTNDIVKEISNLGLEEQSDRLILALRNRYELESTFIQICSNDGIAIVEGDSDDASSEHQSIGGLRVKGMRPSCVNYDEYDPDIINKYGFLAQGLSKEKMANDAAELRRRAANMLWAVENMERMIDPNSRVRYVRQEGEN